MTSEVIKNLSIDLAVSPADLIRIVSTAPQRYKTYQIPKRSGGFRTIAQPSRELKLIQRYVLNHKLKEFSVHKSAFGYVAGRGIRDNAELHSKSRYILKLDFVDFFPSIKVSDWERIAKRQGLKGLELLIYNRILFWGNGGSEPSCLSIGAPTSPTMSNIIMFKYDDFFFNTAKKIGVTYSRYADDITVSADNTELLRRFEGDAIKKILNTNSPKLRFNEEKRGLYGPGEKRLVTGLVITPEKKVSLGRDRKRLISALLHKICIGDFDEALRRKVGGLVGLALSVEPDFVLHMREKYGTRTVDIATKFEKD